METILNYKFAVENAFAQLISQVNDGRQNELNHSDLELEVTSPLFDFPIEHQLVLTRLDPNQDFEPNRD